ncbi:hypothetical protein D3C80_2055220 [compost metagenome]
MGEDFEDIGIGEDFTVIGESDPRFLRAVAIPVGEAVIDQLDRRIISKGSQQY